MKQPLQIAIVGYGIAGVAAAIQLQRLGHHITQFERSHPPATSGAGMLLHPRALRQLQKLGVLDAARASGAPVRRICAQTLGGQPLMDVPYPERHAGQHGLGIQRSALHRLLSDVDPGRTAVLEGQDITSLDCRQGYLSTARQRHGPYDLIVVADGAHSGLREQLPLAVRRNHRADSAALVGLVDDPEQLTGDWLVQHFDTSRHLSVWPAGRDRQNGIARCSVAMNAPLAEAWALRDAGNWRSQMNRLCPLVGRLLADSTAPTWHVFAYRDVELETTTAGRVVLIGDAAHSMSPQLGVGAQLAMEDADVLASSLSEHDDLPTALRAHARTRQAQLHRYQQASRWITPLFQSDSRLLAALRNRFLATTMQAPWAQRLAQELLS